MNKKILYLLLIILTIAIGTYFYCCLLQVCECSIFQNKIEEPIKTETIHQEIDPTINGFHIKNTDPAFELNFSNSYNFMNSDSKIIDPISEELKNGLSTLKDYLSNHPDLSIDISGIFTSQESNDSVFENLGLARANAIKNYLLSFGFSAKQIYIHGVLDNDFTADSSGKLFGPALFKFISNASNEHNASLIEVCEQIKTSPIVLHFETGSSKITLSKAQKSVFTNLIDCVDHLDKKIDVIGHTDNQGTPENNHILGLKRANAVKSFLISKGILEENIIVESKGETEPVTENNTEAGRSTNRRTEITLN